MLAVLACKFVVISDVSIAFGRFGVEFFLEDNKLNCVLHHVRSSLQSALDRICSGVIVVTSEL